MLVGVSLALASTSTSHAGVVIPGLLGGDLTDPDNVAPTNVTVTAGDQAASPAAEMPPMAVDSNRNTKWLAFLPNGTFYRIQFNAGGTARGECLHDLIRQRRTRARSVMHGLCVAPTMARISHDRYANEPGFRESLRDATVPVYNNTPYNIYEFNFQTALGAGAPNPGAPNAIQLSEIELFDFAPTLTLRVNAATGAVQIANTMPPMGYHSMPTASAVPPAL